LKLASPKLDTSHLSRDEEALSRCAIALQQRDNENPQGALEIMRSLWRGVGTRPDTQGLQAETAANVVLCAGILTGWIGARNQIKDAQESARNLITESITYYESNNLAREAAEAWSEIAYCYWREGRVNEARIMLQEALERLPPKGLKRARALLKLADVEHSAARYYDALKLLTDNSAVFASIRYLPVKGSYHNELAITFRTIGTAENRRDYFQRALTEYRAAEHHFKLAKNYIYCASVKNNEAVVLSKLGRFKEAHKHLDQARLITVRLKDRTRTAQIDSTRAELLIAVGKFQARVADLLADGRIVMWFQGAMEYGPRALGQRSVLARPDRPELRDRLNLVLKRRVWYQPFCPSMLESEASRLLADWTGGPNRSMTMAYKVVEQHRAHLAGATSIDGTCRPQIVADDDAGPFAELLRDARRHWQVAAVLNTSFNIHGEPLVCTPGEAVDVFLRSGADALAIGPFLVGRPA
jgi:tetratricopeptide (TPR) repeat protein